MKKEMLGIFGILLFVSLGFVSAGWFDFLKPTGNVIANSSLIQVSMAIGQVYTLSSGKTITVTDINSNSLIFMMIPGEHEIIRLGETRELNGVTIKLESIAYHDNAPETSKVLIEILSSNVLNQSQQTQNNSFPQQNVSNSTQQIVVTALNSCSLGFRVNQTYCSVDGSFISQKATDSSCDNNFECQSNLCINSKCISGSLLDKILSWFKNIFG